MGRFFYLKFGQNQQEIQSYQGFPVLSHYTAFVDASYDASCFHIQNSSCLLYLLTILSMDRRLLDMRMIFQG